MAGRVLALLVLVAAAIGMASAAAPGWNINDVTNLGFRIRPPRQQKGKAIMLEGRMRVNTFKPGDILECGFKNMNATTARFGLHNAKEYYSGKTKNVNFMLTKGQTFEKVNWEWKKEAAAALNGRTIRLTAKVTVDPQTVPNVYTWRWFCEMKYVTTFPGTPADYYWKEFKDVPLTPPK